MISLIVWQAEELEKAEELLSKIKVEKVQIKILKFETLAEEQRKENLMRKAEELHNSNKDIKEIQYIEGYISVTNNYE